MELMDITDKNDKVIGQEYRNKIHRTGQWHRGIHILVFSNGRLILQKRKRKFDLSVSEHLKEGEDYEEGALRGLSEELGASDVKLKKLGKFRMNYGENDNMISVLFQCDYNGKIKSKDEIVFLTNDEIKLMLKDKEKFAKWTLEYLKYFFEMKSELEKI
jgi:isopentenyldiphosphate isomerase